MPFFRRHVKTEPARPATPSPSGQSGQPVAAGAAIESPGSWPDIALAAAQQARAAVERGDSRLAASEWHNMRHAQAKARGYDSADGFTLFNSDVLRHAPQIQEVAELGLTPERVLEMRTILALDGVLYLKAADGVLATLLGRPLPNWKRFWDERQQWLRGTFRPEMWPAILFESEPDDSWEPPALRSLGADARQILAYPRLVRGRSAATYRFLAERTYLSSERVEHAVAELVAAGIAEVPSLEDRLFTLTAAQLKDAHRALSLPGRGVKPALVSAFSSLDADLVHGYLAQHHPSALDAEIAIGVNAGRATDWHIAYAGLIAHWLTVGILSSTRQVNDGGSAGWRILKTDSCPVCRKAPARVPRSRPEGLPPFHIGCRCAA